MPKSKRAKVVHLSKVEKKDKEHRQKIYAEVQHAAETYPYMYVFGVSNMRNTYLKELRSEFDDSRYVASNPKFPQFPLLLLFWEAFRSSSVMYVHGCDK